MAKRRSRAARRRPGRRRFIIRKRRRVGLRQPVHHFKRTTYRENFIVIPQGGANPVFATLNFQLANLPNPAEFTQLYDQYCIKAIKIKFVPRVTTSNALTPARNMWSVIDYDDSVVPTSRDQLLQYQNLKTSTMTRTHTRYFKPAVADEVYATTIATGYGPVKNKWLDCTYDTIEHYGVKVCFDPLPTGGPISYDIITTFYLAFKNV